MYLQELFNKYSEWKIMHYFLKNPGMEVHVKELSRRIDVSPGTASKALNKAAGDDLLNKKIVGNVHIYSLNTKNKHVRKLEKLVSGL